jgi:hypothetical protein
MEHHWIALMVAVSALAMMLGMVRQRRARAVKRWRGVLDAYVEHELARERGERALKNRQLTPPRKRRQIARPEAASL